MSKVYVIKQHWDYEYGPDCAECMDDVTVGIFKSLEDAKKALKNILVDAEEKIDKTKGEEVCDIEWDDDEYLSFDVDWEDVYVEYAYHIEELGIGVFNDAYCFKKEESER